MRIINSVAKKLINYPTIVNMGRNIFGSSYVNNSMFYSRLCHSLANKYNSDNTYGNLQLNIETTLVCNARCLMCTRDSIPQNKGVMDQRLFERIVDESEMLGMKKIILSIFGEPLTDPKFIDRARYVDKKNIPFLFYSNGSLMTENKARSLLALKNFKRVNFSINAFDPVVYNRVMRGLDREKVYKNILDFLKLRNELGSQVKVRISGVIFEDTKDQVSKLKNFWSSQSGVDNVYFPVIRNRAGAVLDIEAKQQKIVFSPLSRRGNILQPCRFLWEDLYVYWDGKVGVCCEDTALRRLIVGDLNNESLSRVWTGTKLNTLRKLHADGKRSIHPVCGKSCTYNTIWIKP